jgi:dipeptidyl aminopeptidase/acylaminoacyl peptidase
MSALTRLDLETGEFETIRASSEVAVEDEYLSLPQTIEFPTENNKTSYGYYYAPKNPDYEPPEGEKPPLIVISHGGPTGSTSTTMNLSTLYWTSRGFGVMDVNYGGSTGYGREYRQRLNGKWGVVDIDDCVNGANYLVERGLADGERLIIRGGSAGGYTTLGALTFRNVFNAGASYYGVSDLEALAVDTHKFESRYLDSMVGPYPGQKDLYIERSPIHHVKDLNTPLIFFQGLEDKVVPPNQAEMMVEALKKKGVPVAYVPFEGEQHGFRQAKNQQRALEAELYFYGKIFGFEPAGDITPVDIMNLD